MSMLGFDI